MAYAMTRHTKMLAEILNEYITWWQEQKLLHGDLWADTDFQVLFLFQQ